MDTFLTYTVFGLSTAAIYAVAASGLVLTYTTSGIFNFAHGAIGMFAAFVYWQLRFQWGWPTPVALVVVLFVLAPLFGAILEVGIMRGLEKASEAVRVVVAVAVLSGLVGLALWIWPPNTARPFSGFYPGSKIHIAGAAVTAHQLISMGCAIAVAIGLALILRRTRAGADMRAVVDNRALLVVFGGRPDRVAALSWAIGASLAALAGILIAPALQLSVLPLTLLVVNAYAAAIIGRLSRLPATFVGALIIGLAEAYGVGYLSSRGGFFGGIRPAIPVLILFVALLALPHARLRGQLSRRSLDWFPSPSMSRAVASAGALVVAALVLGPHLGPANLFTANRALALGIVALSLVPLVGYAGQVALCQMSFAGIGALAMANTAPGGSPLGLVAAFVVAAVAGAIVALPALRLRGIYLALATAAFAVALDRWVFIQDAIRLFGRKIPLFGIYSVNVARPRIGGVSFGSNRAQLVLLAMVFALFALLVVAIRRSAYGRMLLAMRESPAACATLGLRLTVTKLSVFALSAGMAGVGGALLGGVHTAVAADTFSFFQTLPVLLLAVVGGIGTVNGAFLGAVLLGLFQAVARIFPSTNNVINVLPGLAGVGLARNPGGLASDLHMAVAGLRAGRPRRRPAESAEVPVEWIGIDRAITPADVAALDAALGMSSAR
ncbi:MAG: branched-chain amino acid ABC-type transport system, permease component [Acidimicrobiales bacterium]|nr:branched-chain amino acid ABC-type transport system, permease component [Acidimicrobiales bacterium]